MDYPDLVKVYIHLLQGTCQTSKKNIVTVFKSYLNKAKISKNKLLVARHSKIFFNRERIGYSPQTNILIQMFECIPLC